MSVPERIYLQYVEEDDYWSDTTWCIEKINDDDIPYRRERVCKWRNKDGWLWPSCDDTVASAFKPGDYCTYCGGTIRVVGQEEGT